ncbi:MAG: Xaa-Pro peptidase family protein [Sphaerochaetaceae bacterium]|jgi:Xaa-Pro aminopeptidase|nr:Xaa-Pro peptidase family protein [Sphaerochaetaceae bacterium]
MMYQISDEEFSARIKKTQAAMVAASLDILFCYGNEAEPQYVRYYSDYWPSFESACVMIPLTGAPVLLIGPESATYSAYWSRIGSIERIKVLRESSEPEYPGEKLNTLYNLFNVHLDEHAHRRIGIVGYPLMSAPVYKAINDAALAFGCEVVRSEKLVIDQKMIKSPQEIVIMKRAAIISEEAMTKVLSLLKPGMTETQVVAEAEYVIRQLGAENEAYPMWCLSGSNTQHAIGRPDPRRVIKKGDLVQLQFGARVSGYASSVGRPVAMGKVPHEILELMEIGLEAHIATFNVLKPGVLASEVDAVYRKVLEKRGASGCNLYGPCHGSGLMEGEHPWIEATSDYIIQENLTYCVDTFLRRNGYGLRWEDQVAITKDGIDQFTSKHLEILVID